MYDKAPWIFNGNAIYQLQLVKTEEARKHIPSQFKLVEAFGYTLGGFYLARYDSSPAGSFDELVVLAGLVWNAPTSCAWASRVFVNNRDARDHGRTHVGLPSRLASFKPVSNSTALHKKPRHRRNWWDSSPAVHSPSSDAKAIQVFNIDPALKSSSLLKLPICTLEVAQTPPVEKLVGPRIRLALPSFSGNTKDHPGLLKYACSLHTNVAFMKPLSIRFPSSSSSSSSTQDSEEIDAVVGILRGRPLLAMAFSGMEMRVNAPQPFMPLEMQS